MINPPLCKFILFGMEQWKVLPLSHADTLMHAHTFRLTPVAGAAVSAITAQRRTDTLSILMFMVLVMKTTTKMISYEETEMLEVLLKVCHTLRSCEIVFGRKRHVNKLKHYDKKMFKNRRQSFVKKKITFTVLMLLHRNGVHKISQNSLSTTRTDWQTLGSPLQPCID